MSDEISMTPRVAVIGAGPAGLMAADALSARGLHVSVHDRMPSVARKFLMAGRGGLNLTHTEPLDRFLSRYREGADMVAPAIDAFGPTDLRAFAHALGEDTFAGTSGRVFPRSFKASPLLRAWLARLRARDVTIATRETLVGFEGARPILAGADGARRVVEADATVLALGGASWPRLGSDGAWVPLLRDAGVAVAPLAASNCGVTVRWSDDTRARFAGAPLKRVAFAIDDRRSRGEAVVTAQGFEGGAIYALSSDIREAVARDGAAVLHLDLIPDVSVEDAAAKLAAGRPKDSRANRLRKALALSPAASAMLREGAGGPPPRDADALARHIKALPLHVVGVSGLDRAISSAGGLRAVSLDKRFMVKAVPGLFAAGEMLDWDAPTGGYLLQAAFSTGLAAAEGVMAWLADPSKPTRLCNSGDPLTRHARRAAGPSGHPESIKDGFPLARDARVGNDMKANQARSSITPRDTCGPD